MCSCWRDIPCRKLWPLFPDKWCGQCEKEVKDGSSIVDRSVLAPSGDADSSSLG